MSGSLNPKVYDTFQCSSCDTKFTIITTKSFCKHCGIPLCPKCYGNAYSCPCHTLDRNYSEFFFIGSEITCNNITPAFKRLRTMKTGRFFESPATISCDHCDSFMCVESYERNAKYCNMYNFHPKRAHKYLDEISEKVFTLLLLKNHPKSTIPKEIPNDIIYMIVDYFYLNFIFS